METAASSVLTQDPRTYFAYDACRYCRSTPCRELMHKCHTVYGSRFVVTHNRTYNTHSPCVFASPSWSEIHRTFLCNISQPDLAQIASRLIANLSVAETLQYSVDTADPAALIEHLWKSRVIAFIRVPHLPDEKIRAWLSSWRDAIFVREKREKKAETVTDAAAEAAVSAIGPELLSAKWVHTDETAKKERPGVTAIGDKILLSVETKNIADGQSLIFKVHNVAGKAARTLESIEAKVKANMAQTEWTVVKDDKQEEMEFEFDAGFGGSVCGRCGIPLKDRIYQVRLFIDPADKDTIDDTYVLFSVDDKKTYYQQKTIKDDKVAGDCYLDLEFTGVVEELKYSLVIDPGKDGDPYYVFTNVAGNALLNDEELVHTDENSIQ